MIPAGTFRMGCVSGRDPCYSYERPVHEVEVSSFALSKHEVTRGQFAAFVAATGHNTRGGCVGIGTGSWRDKGWQNDGHPVVCVSWEDAQAYVRWLRRETGGRYRLPSESEWEYAGRGGTTTAWFWDDRGEDWCEYANAGDSDDRCDDGWERTAPVGSFPANGSGLHDMAGNVWEWVEDCWHDDYDGAPRDGSAWTRDGDCSRRVLRGGSWSNDPWFLRSAYRGRHVAESRHTDNGFRVARTPN